MKQLLENPKLLDEKVREKLLNDLVQNINNLDGLVSLCSIFFLIDFELMII